MRSREVRNYQLGLVWPPAYSTSRRLYQQTRYINPVLVQCWASVVAGGPTLHQHWVDVSCLLGRSAGQTFILVSNQQSRNDNAKLVQRRKQWTNIKPTLDQCFMLLGSDQQKQHIKPMLDQRCPPSATMQQH